MFNLLKKKSKPAQAPATADTAMAPASLSSRLSRTRERFSSGLASLLNGKKSLDKSLLQDIETHLLTADVGIKTTDAIVQSLTEQLDRKQLDDSNVAMSALQQILSDKLAHYAQPFTPPTRHTPAVVLVIGVNGAGKTTTIAKLAKQYQQLGKSVMLAAGDTFRAAAIEQLKTWGKRNNAPVVAHAPGADSAAVIFDALETAQQQQADILLVDTAGRLHNKDHLMRELQKIHRVIQKFDSSAPHEVLLVLDASTGQSGLQQALAFDQDIGITGIVITKLDGTAKGGVIFAIADQLQKPIRYIGIGEGVDDLRPFDAQAFVEALFG